MASHPDPQQNINSLIAEMTKHRNTLAFNLKRAQSSHDTQTQRAVDQEISSVLQTYKKTLQASIASQQKNQRHLEEGFRAQKAALATLSQELHGTELFLSRQDRTSTDEVAKAVGRLNGEIKRGAEAILEVYEELESSIVDAVHERDVTYDVFWGPPHLKERIGEDLFHTIADMGRKGNRAGLAQSEAIEWSIRAYFVWWSCWIFNHFLDSCGPTGEPDSATLDELYKVIQSRDPQTYSARWRALTHGALGQDKSDYPPNTIYVGILALVYIGGLSTAAVGDARLTDVIKKYAAIVVNGVRDIKEQARVNIVSMDLELYAVKPGSAFDKGSAVRLSQGTRGEGGDENERGQDQGTSRVLSTVGVGLRALVTVEGRSEAGRSRKVIHFPQGRAEVVLHSDVISDN